MDFVNENSNKLQKLGLEEKIMLLQGQMLNMGEATFKLNVI
jgi:hypothetical protein